MVKWTDKPFVDTIERLLTFFRKDRRALEKAEQALKAASAARTIQAAWRGHILRQRVRKLKPAVQHIEQLWYNLIPFYLQYIDNTRHIL